MSTSKNKVELSEKELQIIEANRELEAKITNVSKEISELLSKNNLKLTVDYNSPVNAIRIIIVPV